VDVFRPQTEGEGREVADAEEAQVAEVSGLRQTRRAGGVDVEEIVAGAQGRTVLRSGVVVALAREGGLEVFRLLGARAGLSALVIRSEPDLERALEIIRRRGEAIETFVAQDEMPRLVGRQGVRDAARVR
jgi:hypothetical protein